MQSTRVPPKCRVCQINRSDTIWQPFGPDESPYLFVRPGFHYRGFPAVHICSDCEKKIQQGQSVKIVLNISRDLYLFKDGKMTKLEGHG